MKLERYMLDGMYNYLKRLERRIRYVNKAISDKRNDIVPHLRYQKRTLISLEKELKDLKEQYRDLNKLYLDAVYKVSNRLLIVTELEEEIIEK